MHPTVFHLRLRDFELQAERRIDAALITRPVAIISSHHQNGTVISLSKEAEAEGLRKGMKVSLVRQMNHGARILPYNATLYSRIHEYIHKIVQRFTPIVEPSGYGEFYMDMTGMNRIYPSDEEAGIRISNKVQDEVGLSTYLGISQNKLVSRISTSVIPDPIHRIITGDEARFLSPLDSPVIPTVHQPSVWKLVQFMILRQVCHIQSVVDKTADAQYLFGKYALSLTREVRGQDMSVVRPPLLKDHILKQAVMKEDTNDTTKIYFELKHVSEEIAFQLRQRSQVAKSVRLEIHYTDAFKFEAKGSCMKHNDTFVLECLWRLFERANHRRNRVRSILVDVSQFIYVADQIELFKSDTKRDRISNAVDILRKKYKDINFTHNFGDAHVSHHSI